MWVGGVGVIAYTQQDLKVYIVYCTSLVIKGLAFKVLWQQFMTKFNENNI